MIVIVGKPVCSQATYRAATAPCCEYYCQITAIITITIGITSVIMLLITSCESPHTGSTS